MKEEWSITKTGNLDLKISCRRVKKMTRGTITITLSPEQLGRLLDNAEEADGAMARAAVAKRRDYGWPT